MLLETIHFIIGALVVCAILLSAHYLGEIRDLLREILKEQRKRK